MRTGLLYFGGHLLKKHGSKQLVIACDRKSTVNLDRLFHKIDWV